MKHVLGLIPARGGSKGLPRKNIRMLAGKPMISWTIESAKMSRLLDQTIVSTEDEEIAEISRLWGVEVPFMRPSTLAQDDSSSASVAIHALEWLIKNAGYQPDYLVLLQPTSPLRTANDIDMSIELAYEKDAEAVVSVEETHVHPYLTRQMTKEGKLIEFVECSIPYMRRQVLPKAYFINGAIFIIRSESLIAKKTFYPEGTYGYIMPSERSLQVDTRWDFDLANVIISNNLNKSETHLNL